MNDMDVLIGRIKARIKGCKDIIKSNGMPKSSKEIAEVRMDTYGDILKEIEEITK